MGGNDLDQQGTIKETHEGGFIVAGLSWSKNDDVTGNHEITDYWIVKLDSAGTIQWERSYGGSDDDWANEIEETKDHGYIVAGGTWSNDGDITNNYGCDDDWILKIDSIGNTEWQKSFGGSSSEYAFSIRQIMDDGYIFVGVSKARLLSKAGLKNLLHYQLFRFNP